MHNLHKLLFRFYNLSQVLYGMRKRIKLIAVYILLKKNLKKNHEERLENHRFVNMLELIVMYLVKITQIIAVYCAHETLPT